MLYKKKYGIIVTNNQCCRKGKGFSVLQLSLKNGGSLNMKKIIALFCAIAIMLGMGLSAFAAADSRGNCDGSVGGEVDITDAMLLFYYVAKKITVQDVQDPEAMDINQDYAVDITDAMLLFYYVAKKPDSDFPAFDDSYDYAKLRQILGID